MKKREEQEKRREEKRRSRLDAEKRMMACPWTHYVERGNRSPFASHSQCLDFITSYKVRSRHKGRAFTLLILAFLASFCLVYHYMSPYEYSFASRSLSSQVSTCNNSPDNINNDSGFEDRLPEENQVNSESLTPEGKERLQRVPHFPRTKRRLPQCIIIGVRKCGTRALLEFLNIHSAVQKAQDEVHFFDDESKYGLGLEWYRKQMPYSFPEQVTIEKSPAYFVTDSAPFRVHAMNASIKLVLIVRDPVTRLISDYAQLAANKAKKERRMPSFENLVLLPNGQVDTSYKPVRTSMYAAYYSRWTQVFDSHQIHIVDGDRLVYDPYPEVQRVEQFLNLSHRIGRDNFSYNATKGFYCVKLNGTGSEKCLNESKGRRHPEVDPQVVQSLRRFYAPYNRQFYRSVGRDFGWPEI